MLKRKARNDLIAALDVGSSKVACFVARTDGFETTLDSKGPIARVVGIGFQVSRGIRSGNVIDMDGAWHAVTAAVVAAEKMAGEALREVVVNIACGSPESKTYPVEIQISGHEVAEGDIRRVNDAGRSALNGDGRRLIHALPVAYSIDGSRGIRDPRGMTGQVLGGVMHAITAASGAVRNLEAVINRCQLNVDGAVVGSYASGLACLVDDELDLGVTVIDMGGGATSFAVFCDGQLLHTDSIAVGGMHVTNDIARGLSTPLAHAERLKTLHGSTITTQADEREIVDVPLVGEDEHGQPNHVPKSLLTGIIRPRLEETFEMVRARLEKSGYDKVAGRRVVLTGGAAQLQGARDLASVVLDKQVRIGRPLRLAGLSDQTGGPAFSTCAGLVAWAVAREADPLVPVTGVAGRKGGPFTIFRWVRENFLS
jgi:cell division protein FtsA